jgi:hypothetical protein
MRPLLRHALPLLLLIPLVAGDAPAGPAPGHHRDLTTPDGRYHYNLFIPGRHAAEPEARLPTLWLSSPVGNPGTFDLHDWAERNGVIIVGFKDSKNGLPDAEIRAIQDAVRMAVKSTLRVHPCLNFAAGISGGANCSMFLVNRHPDEFAGVLMICMSGIPKAKHHSCGWIHGAKDDVIGVGGVWSSHEAMTKAGRPCTIVVNRSRQHTPGSREEKEVHLDYALAVARLTHPQLSKEEIKAAYLALDADLTAAATLADPAARMARIEFLARLPNAAKCPAYPAALAAWGAAAVAGVSAAPTAPERFERLMRLAAHPLVAGLDSAGKRTCAALRAELGKDPVALAHWDAVGTYDKLFEMEQRAGLDPAKLGILQDGFRQLAEKHPTHPCGLKAAKDVERLDKYR